MNTFCFDIDGVIATVTPVNDYALARPIPGTVALVNKLYALGHRIVLFTARGSVTGIDWTRVTRRQMRSFGVKYHELRFGKPAADFYIDDRMISLDQARAMSRARPSKKPALARPRLAAKR